MSNANLQVVADEESFVATGVALLKGWTEEALKEHGRAVLGFSGGSTPGAIYEKFGKEKLHWSRVWIFLVDDRCIAADDPKSNQFLLRSTLLKSAPIPESQIIFPDTPLPPEKSAAEYGKHLEALFAKGQPDAITLGLGEDGHIASLFPPLSRRTDASIAITTQTDRFPVRERISVSLDALATAHHAVFFLKGKEKAKIWEDMTTSAEGEERWPAKKILAEVQTEVVMLS